MALLVLWLGLHSTTPDLSTVDFQPLRYDETGGFASTEEAPWVLIAEVR